MVNLTQSDPVISKLIAVQFKREKRERNTAKLKEFLVQELLINIIRDEKTETWPL